MFPYIPHDIPPEMVLLLFQFSLTLLVLGTVGLIALYAPVKLLEVNLDPPEGAHYMSAFTNKLQGDDEELVQEMNAAARPANQPLDEEAIERLKMDELLYHSVVYCEGRFQSLELYRVIKEKWNSQYERYPELKEWRIAKTWLENVIREQMDYDNTGRVFRIVEGNSAKFPAGYYIVLEHGEKRARKLVNVGNLITLYRQHCDPTYSARSAAAVDPKTEIPASLSVLKHLEQAEAEEV